MKKITDKIQYIEITKDSWHTYKELTRSQLPNIANSYTGEKIRWDVASDVEYAEDMLEINDVSNLTISAWRSIDNNRVTCREVFDVQKLSAILIRVY